MESRSLHLLEFPKVLERLSGYAVSEAGQFACTRLQPYGEQCVLLSDAALFEQFAAWKGETSVPVSWFPDLAGLFDTLDSPSNILDLDDLVALRDVLEKARQAREFYGPFREREWPELSEFMEFAWAEQCWSAVKRCLGPDGLIRDGASPELFGVRQEIRSLNQNCTQKVKNWVRAENISHLLQDDFVTIVSDRFVIPLKANFKGRLEGIVHEYSQTGETCYFEPLLLVELNNRLQDLKNEERREELVILKYLTELARAERDELEATFAFLVQLDVLSAKGEFAIASNSLMLVPEKDKAVKLLKARHPLLALVDGKTRAIDVDMPESVQALIVSGGNAGGKTVCLKTLGLIALMALSGIPVPVQEGSELPAFKKIFAILGDEQSIEDSLSTFSAQIHSVSSSWNAIGPDTLVILDEFGAGTDPTQGAALAQGLVDGLMDKGARVAAATHFPALKAYGLTRDNVRAASVMFDPATKKPLFTLAYDQIGASIALDVAREHGLPDVVLEKAERYLLLDGSDSSKLLDRLNAQAVQRERELASLENERAKFEKKRARLEERFKKEKEQLLEEINVQARTIVKEWQKGKVERKQARKKLDALRQKLTGTEETTQKKTVALDFSSLQPGMTVTYLPWNREGRVDEVDQRKKKVKIDLAGVALWAGPAEIRISAGKQSGKHTSGISTTVTDDSRGSSMFLDLRGQRADVAVAELERFLDKALLTGLSHIEIIHGRGTGALRREVHDFLKRFPAVESFSLASEEDGGDGKTVAVLK